MRLEPESLLMDTKSLTAQVLDRQRIQSHNNTSISHTKKLSCDSSINLNHFESQNHSMNTMNPMKGI